MTEIVTITLNAEQLASVDAQRAGVPYVPPIDPHIPPPPPPYVPPIEGVHEFEIPWSNSGNLPLPEVPKGEVLSIKTVTGSISSTGSLPHFACAEYNSGPRERLAVLSLTPGDFDHPIGNATGATMRGKSVTALFAVGAGSGMGYYPVVPLNTAVYLNIKTLEDGDDQSRQMFASLSINQL